MKLKIRMNLLGIYDLILSIGAIYIGRWMVLGSGVFADFNYPNEWQSKVPFENWVVPGIIAILVFGLGNIIAAIYSFINKNNRSWLMSAVMGGVFLISLVFQVILLGEWYMATVQFFIFSIIQLCLSGFAYSGYRKNQLSTRL